MWWQRAVAFLDDPKRQSYRRSSNIHFLLDYLYTSEVSHYPRVRHAANFVLGVLFSTLLYWMVGDQINFTENRPVFQCFFAVFIVLGFAVIFAGNAGFRCTVFIVIICCFGSNGQLPVMVTVFRNVQQGPVTSIVSNSRSIAEAVLCNLQVQTDIAASRVSLITGPVEQLIDKQISAGVEAGKKVSSLIKSLMEPFRSDITEKKTQEDKESWYRKQVERVAAERRQRQRQIEQIVDNENNLTPATTVAPFSKMKTSFGKQVAERMQERCEDVFNQGLMQCHESYESLKRKCYIVMGLWSFIICERLEVSMICSPDESKKEIKESCKENPEGSQFESRLAAFNQASHGIDDEFKLSMHVAAVEMPKYEGNLFLADVRAKIKAVVDYVKLVLATCMQLFTGLFVFVLYFIFRRAADMVNSYRDNVEFKNNFLTHSFWKINEMRRMASLPHIRKISNRERKEHGLLSPYGLPTKEETESMWLPFLKFFIVSLVVSAVIVVDRYSTHLLKKFLTASIAQSESDGRHSISLDVEGNGTIAEIMRNILSISVSQNTNQTFSNEHCVFDPMVTPDSLVTAWIVAPLIVMLVTQVIFSFLVDRLLFFNLFPFMFPKRARVRIIYLYNKLLISRIKTRKHARQRIRFLAARWLKNPAEDIDFGLFSRHSFFKKQVFDRIFKTASCLVCEDHVCPIRLIKCDACPAMYCRACKEELHSCYACQVREGIVNSEKTEASDRLNNKEGKTKDKEEKSQNMLGGP